MPVTLLNVFIVPEDKEAEFVTEWKKTADVFSGTKGFLETHLHRNTGIGNATFRFINIATWKSAEAWRISHDVYRPTEYDIPGVKGHPSMWTIPARASSARRVSLRRLRGRRLDAASPQGGPSDPDGDRNVLRRGGRRRTVSRPSDRRRPSVSPKHPDFMDRVIESDVA